MSNLLHLSIPESEWQPNPGFEDPLVGLTGPTLVINGLSMHVEAWQVTDTGIDQDPAATWSEEYNLLHAAVHADGSFQTLRLHGRDYIIVISPHCD
jgi:hypothetical protein